MEWFELVSQYQPADPSAPTFYDQLRIWADQYRAYVIFVELLVVYYLGFATRIRMPILKTVFLYILLFIGALIFGILDWKLPVKSSLFVAVLILVLVRLRAKPENRGDRG
jgi:CHASE2 domain-containing sensor protein